MHIDDISKKAIEKAILSTIVIEDKKTLYKCIEKIGIELNNANRIVTIMSSKRDRNKVREFPMI